MAIMTQQQDIRASPVLGSGTFREEVLSILAFRLETEKIDTVEALFKGAVAFFSCGDGSSEIEREGLEMISRKRKELELEAEEKRRKERQAEQTTLCWALASALQQMPQKQPEGQCAKETVEPEAAEPLKNSIFIERLFNTDQRLRVLRQTIADAIDMGGAGSGEGRPLPTRIDPMVQSEWYYISKAIEEAGIAHKFTDREFVMQMVAWFPEIFEDTDEKKLRKMAKSISGERSLWRQGETNAVVRLDDMWAAGMGKRLGHAKATRIHNITVKGLIPRFEKLKEEL